MKQRLAGLALALTVALAGCKPAADQDGYFKSATSARVYAFAVDAPLTEAQAVAVLGAAKNTAGQMTVAVIYEPGAPAPGDRLTLAPDLPAALRVVGEAPFDGWAWRLTVNPAGARQITRGE